MKTRIINRLICLMLFCIYTYNTAISQNTGTFLTIITQEPPDTLNVCLDTTQFTIILQNDSAVTIDSILIEHIMFQGVEYAGSFIGASSVDTVINNNKIT